MIFRVFCLNLFVIIDSSCYKGTIALPRRNKKIPIKTHQLYILSVNVAFVFKAFSIQKSYCNSAIKLSNFLASYFFMLAINYTSNLILMLRADIEHWLWEHKTQNKLFSTEKSSSICLDILNYSQNGIVRSI